MSMRLQMNPNFWKPLSALACQIPYRLSMNVCFMDEEMEAERTPVTFYKITALHSNRVRMMMFSH